MYTINTKINNQISIWLITMFWIISIMIIVGGLTRLTDSGLSITKWQLFSGFLPPLSNEDWIKYFELYKKIPEFTEQNYLMTMNEFKVIFWWEWAHRFLGRLIGISFLIPLIYFTFLVNIGFYVLTPVSYDGLRQYLFLIPFLCVILVETYFEMKLNKMIKLALLITFKVSKV